MKLETSLQGGFKMPYNMIKTIGRLITKHIWCITKKGTVIYIQWNIFRIIKLSMSWFDITFHKEAEFVQSVNSTKRGKIHIYDTDGKDLTEIYGFYAWNVHINQWIYFKLVKPREMVKDGSDFVRYTVINDGWQLYIGKKRIRC